jgi:multicomponent K+:H+ antiporter subunit E
MHRLRHALAVLVPAPGLSLLLWLAWLMLNQSSSAGHVLLGLALALVLPWFTEGLRPDKPRLRKLSLGARLLVVVLRDIVMSNIQVARLVLGPESRINSRFVWVPLSIRDSHGQLALAGIITMTPGTLSAAFSDDRRHLLVHAFHVEDDAAEAALVADIKARYEAPLMEIFE